MKLFKNRGDIYISKTDIKDDIERKILLIILAIIILFTIIFLILVGSKNDFSAKKFFAPDENAVTAVTDSSGEGIKELPIVSGKQNTMFVITDADGEEMYLASIIQFDMDSVSYKVSNFLPETIIETTSINRTFINGGIKNTVNAIESQFDISIDNYAVLTAEELADFYDKLGRVTFPVLNDIKFKDTTSEDGYSVRLKAGEQKLDGKEIVNLLRYYVIEKKEIRTANDIVLYSLTQLINTNNYNSKDALFKYFMSIADTDITVKEFSAADDMFMVLSDENTGANTYNIEIKYNEGVADASSVSQVKSYFGKQAD